MRLLGGWRAASCLGAALVAVSAGVGAQGLKDLLPDWWKDPFGIDQKTSPAPQQRWQSTRPLPVVPEPKSAAEALKLETPLSLPELTEFALINNPRTRQAWFTARAAAGAVGVLKGDDFPTITGGYIYQRSRPASGTTGVVGNWLKRWGPSISISYTIYDFGLGDARLEAAEARLLAANLGQNRVLQELIFLVEQAYYQLIGIEALVRVNEQALKNVETALDAARRRRDSGVATVADVFRSETQVAQAQLTLTRSRGDFEKARGQLAAVVGLPVNSALRVLTLSAPPQTRQNLQTITSYLDTVKSLRPDLVAVHNAGNPRKYVHQFWVDSLVHDPN